MRHHLLLIPSLAVFAAAAPLSAQCLDFSNDFVPANSAVNAEIHALAEYDDGTGPALYAAGDFTLAGGVPAAHIARWDGVGWSPLGSGTSSSVFCLQVFDDGTGSKLFAGGTFLTAGGMATGPIAAWDGTTWSVVGGGIPSGAVMALTTHDDGTGLGLYAGGSFNQAGVGPAANVARYQFGFWSALGPGTGPGVQCLASFDSGSGPTLYVGGYIATAGGFAVGRIARWQGGSWASLQNGVSGLNDGVLCMKTFVDGGVNRLFVGGSFDYVNGSACRNLARWTGTTWQPCNVSLTRDDPVRDLEVFDAGGGGVLYATGKFSVAGTPGPNGHIAAWTGTNWVGLQNGLLPLNGGSPPGQALLASSFLGAPRLFVGGAFQTAGGKPSPNVAVWGEACGAPTVFVHPQSTTAQFEAPTVFTTAAAGTHPVSFQWRRNGIPLVDDAHLSGATTPTLTLFYYSYLDFGDYDCVVSNPYGSVVTNSGHLTIPLSGTSGIPLHLRRIVYPPEPVSTLPPGSTFEFVYPALQSSTEEVLAPTTINGQPALVRFDQAVPTVLIKGLDPAPLLGPGYTFPGQFNPFQPYDKFLCGAGGQVVARGSLEGWAVTPENRGVIWYFEPGVTRLVVHENDPAAGLAAGSVFRSLKRPALSDSGRVLFASDVFQGGSYATTGVWSWTPTGGTTLLARIGDAAPGTTTTFRGFTDEYRINAVGASLLWAELDSVTGIHNSSVWDSGLFLETGGVLQRVACSGDFGPGMVPGTNMEEFWSFELDDGNDVLFTSRLAYPGGVTRFATFRWHQGALTLIGIYGQALPDTMPGSVLSIAHPWASNSNGSLVLYAQLQTSCTPPCPTRGLWLSDSTGLQTIALKGGPPYPDMPVGYDLTDFNHAVINSSDQVAFGATFYSGSSVTAIYGWSPTTGLFPIAIPGTQVDIGNHDYRTIKEAQLTSEVGGSNGTRGTDLDDAGGLSMWVRFTDSTTGLFRANFNALAAVYGNVGTKYCFGDGTGTPCPCGNVALPGQGCANTTGVGSELIGMGSTSVLDDDLRFLASNLPVNKPCLLLQSPSVSGGGAGVPLSDGLLCVGSPVKRLASGVSSPVGQMMFGPGLAAPGLWAAGQTRYLQSWYRNIGGPCGAGSNLTNGFQVTFVP